MSDRIQKSNLSSHSQEEESNDDTQDGNNFVESEPSTPTSVTSIETTPSVATSKGKKRTQQRIAPQNSVANVLEKYLESQATKPAVNTEPKGLRQFFIAMADTAETFPPEIQIEVKSKVFKIIEEAEIKCLQPKVNAPPQPSSSYGFSHSGFQDENSSHFTNYPQGSQTPYPQGSQRPYPQGS